MFHFIKGQIISQREDKSFVLSQDGKIGIEVFYRGKQRKEVDLWLFPYIDENLHTLKYFAFDFLEQKELFEQITKLPGLWPKTAFYVASLPVEELREALKKWDVNFFSAIPGIGAKTAKRIIVELQWAIPSLDESVSTIEKKVISALKNYGYETDQIKDALKKMPFSLSEDNMPQAMSRLLKNL